jgi:phosphohistidine phosphatase
MNLYIVRHAIAVERGTPGYEDDSQRPLTDDGVKKMKKVAKGLYRLGIKMDVILTSPYVRARDTAKILADRYDMIDRIFFSDNLIPPGNFESLVFEMHEKYDLANVALVGHEPMLSSLISWLITGDTDARVTLKKGGAACLSSDSLYQDGRAALQWLLTPSIMMQIKK